jgi:hypothetical protein
MRGLVPNIEGFSTYHYNQSINVRSDNTLMNRGQRSIEIKASYSENILIGPLNDGSLGIGTAV